MKKYVLIFGLIMAFDICAQSTTSGSCAKNGTNSTCTWSYDSTTKKLTISGSGAMADYGPYYDGDYHTTAPWNMYEREVKNVVIEDGISNIGSYAFYHVKMENISIADSVTQILGGALQYSSLKELNIPNSVTYIGGGALNGIGTLHYITLPDSLDSIGGMALGNTAFYSIIVDGNTILTKDMLKDGCCVVSLSSYQSIYCNETNESCLSLKNDEELGSLITSYQNKNGLYETEDGKLFANLDLMAHGVSCKDKAQCQDLLVSAAQGTFVFGGKTYASLDDLARGNYIPKRIYTIDEANAVAGKTNSFKIRYR